MLSMIKTCMRARSESGRRRWNNTHVVSIIIRIVILVVILTFTLVAIILILFFVYDSSNISSNIDQVPPRLFHIRLYQVLRCGEERVIRDDPMR